MNTFVEFIYEAFLRYYCYADYMCIYNKSRRDIDGDRIIY
jgi:hypothetical protein